MQSYFLKTICLTSALFLITSCANYKLHEGNSVTDWKAKQEATNIPISHSIYLIGDVGFGSTNSANPTLAFLKKHLNDADENTSVLFLGNNTSAMGMPPKEKIKNRSKAEIRLNGQLDILEKFKGQPIFLPGNRDWGFYGLKGLNRQEDYIESALNEGIEDDDDWNNLFPAG